MTKADTDEYLEAVFDLGGADESVKTGDVAARMGVAPASVTEVVQRLAKKGLVAYEPYKGARLTPKGLVVAKKIKRKHRLLEVFLAKVLRIDGKKVHEEACKMEHAISDETEEALCKMLGAPKECPHGSPIPECDDASCKVCPRCLGDSQVPPGSEDAVPLTSLPSKGKGIVQSIHGGRGACQRLADLGLTTGSVVIMMRRAPLHGPVEVCSRGCNIVIGREIAEKVMVVPQEG